MSTDRDTTRLVRSWLAEGVTEFPDRVLDAVLDQVSTTRQRRVSWLAWMDPSVRATLRLVSTAAVIAVIAIAGYQLLLGSGVGSRPTPTPRPISSPSPTATPTPMPTPRGLLEPGTTVMFYQDVTAGFRVDVTVPGGDWYQSVPAPGILTKRDSAEPPDGAGIIVFTGALDVYGDPCTWSSTRPQQPNTSADEIAAALVAQPMRDATATEITVDGYTGRAVELTVPASLDFADCDNGEFRSWVQGGDSARFHQGPGQQDVVWIIDVDGTPLVINAAFFDETPSAVQTELRAILDSIQIEPQP